MRACTGCVGCAGGSGGGGGGGCLSARGAHRWCAGHTEGARGAPRDAQGALGVRVVRIGGHGRARVRTGEGGRF